METLTIHRKIHFQLGRNNRNQIKVGEPPQPKPKKPTRGAELAAFAIVFDDWLSQGKAENLSDICLATGLSRAAVSRIMEYRLRPPKELDTLVFETR